MSKGFGQFLIGAVLIAGSFLIPFPAGYGFLATTMLGTGIGFASRAIFKPAGLAARLQSFQQTVTSTVAELPVIYGTYKIGTRITEVRTGAGAPNRLAWVGALCHGGSTGAGISAINEIYIDDRLAANAAGTIQSGFKNGATSRIPTLAKYLGTDTQTADGTLTGAFVGIWTAACRGRGIAYLAMILEFDPKVFTGFPQTVTAIVDGRKVYDPRDWTVKFSSNPMLCLRDYLTDMHYGVGIGRRVAYTAAQVAQSGMGSFTASKLIDGDVAATAWSTDAASSGATIRVDFSSAIELMRCAIWVAYTQGLSPNPGTTDQYAGNYTVEYSDDDAAWSTAITGFIPRNPYRNDISWGNRGSHRYWRIRLTNTPGAGAELTELEWFETELNDAALIAAANYCDQLIPVPPADAAYKTITAATTATPIACTCAGHGLSTGDTVDIKQIGLTIPGLNVLGQFVVTVSDASHFTLNSTVGSGTYVGSTAAAGKLTTQKRFECHGALDTGASLEENIRQILSSCRGQMVWEGGQFKPYVEDTASPVLTFTEDDILGPLQITMPGLRDQFNKGVGVYVDPAKNYQADTITWPPDKEVNTYLLADAEFEVDGDFELPLTANRYTAEQILMVGVRESRKGIQVSATFPERMLQATCGDVVALTHTTPGWSAKSFRVKALALQMNGQVVTQLREYDPAVYTLDPHQQSLTPPASALPDPFSVLAPTSLVLSAGDSEIIIDPTGAWLSRIKLAWTASADPYLDHYEVQAKRTAEANYDSYGNPVLEDTIFFVSPVNNGESWDVQVRAINTLGRPSAWLQGTITVGGSIKPPPLGIVDFFDDYPGTRWSNTGTGGSSAVRTSPDSRYGGKVLGLVANRTGEWIPYIPFDQTQLYAIRGRVRCLVGASSPSNDFFLGFKCYDNALNLLSDLGAGSGNSIIGAAANFRVLTPGFTFTDLAGYIRGWNGAWYAPPAGVLTNSGFNGFTAANVGDGLATAVAFHSDTATSGATLTIDLGVGVTKAFIRAKVYLNAGSGVAQYKVQYSDNGSAWNDVTFRGAGVTWTPANAGWNEVDWGYSNAGSAKHRYWRLLLNNTPGGGPDVMEWQMLELSNTGVSAGPFTDPNSPGVVPPGTAYIRPYFQARGGTASGWAVDCDHEIDLIEMPPAAGSTALV